MKPESEKHLRSMWEYLYRAIASAAEPHLDGRDEMHSCLEAAEEELETVIEIERGEK